MTVIEYARLNGETDLKFLEKIGVMWGEFLMKWGVSIPFIEQYAPDDLTALLWAKKVTVLPDTKAAVLWFPHDDPIYTAYLRHIGWTYVSESATTIDG
ncbi:hypothetical protein FACS1894184_04700 [Clostridia bacterium]|nr:hypothetical protein FACS1894184_04700 [Clostridia bacterium]